MWQMLVDAFSSMINFFYIITQQIGIPSYGLAIILITIVIKMLLYPLSAKQMKSMKVMAELAPKQKALQEKYKKDPQKAQEAMMQLYKEHGVNPLSGCLPLLIQFPILIAFYNGLMAFPYLNEAHATFLWVANLSAPDPYILPLLATATTFLQMKVTPSSAGGNPQAEQTQKIMMYSMPLLIGWMAHSFAAGLSLYWVTFNTVGILQQLYMNRSLNVRKEGTA
ncbi:stage iii sporulation protein j/oxaa-like protein precursor [Heliomicrobium modesticaldum Ice1]|uniref:Stage iii sporulation protein j/oxaa-like protein n=1 Tax=Heliobacterium modesticaldum (strain ATCC 51547 / Ice1) TaxID=498761 RepID=B0TAB8_HELMI|nr:stage iii sporulation protein j/oxaa-like protein precursor [Heliomicrobium modesticaldum Ice1]